MADENNMPSVRGNNPIESLAQSFMEQARRQDALKQRLHEEVEMHEKTRNELEDVRSKLGVAHAEIRVLNEKTGEMTCQNRERATQIQESQKLVRSVADGKRRVEKQLDSAREESRNLKASFVERTRETNDKLRVLAEMYTQHVVTTEAIATEEPPSARELELRAQMIVLQNLVEGCKCCSGKLQGDSEGDNPAT